MCLTSNFIEKAIRVHKNLYLYDKVVYVKNTIEVSIFCKKHSEYFKQQPRVHLAGGGCQECGLDTRRMSLEKFKRYGRLLYDNEHSYEKVVYVKNNRAPVIVTCKEHGDFKVKPQNYFASNNTKSYRGCPECGKILKKKHSIEYNKNLFLERLEKIDSTLDTSSLIYKDQTQLVKLICLKHGEFEGRPNNILRSDFPCPECRKEYMIPVLRSNTEEFIKKATIIHRNDFNYDDVNYIKAIKKVKINCNTCNRLFKITPNDHLSGHGCTYCKISRGEKKIQRFLEANNIFFETQKWFKECRDVLPLKFDFFLPEYNILIEFDGEQHFKPIKFFGGQKAFEKRIKRDAIKDKWVEKSEYNLFRIPYYKTEDINLLLTEKLRYSGCVSTPADACYPTTDVL